MGYTVYVNPSTSASQVFAQGTLTPDKIKQLREHGYTYHWYSSTIPTTNDLNRILAASTPQGQQRLAQVGAQQSAYIAGLSKDTSAPQTNIQNAAASKATTIPKKVPPNLNVSQKAWDKLGSGAKASLLRGDVVVTTPKEVSPEVYAALGPGVTDKGIVTPKLTVWHRLYGTDAPLGSAKTWKAAATWGAEAIIPFVYTVRHWNEMPNWEKGLNLFADVAVMATTIKPAATGINAIKANRGINIKAIEVATKQKIEVVEAAKQAQKARLNLRDNLTIVQNAEKAGVLRTTAPIVKAGKTGVQADMFAPAKAATGVKGGFGGSLSTAMLTNLDEAARVSSAADERFVRAFTALKEIHPHDLKQLEKISGFKGISKGVEEINTAQKVLSKEWSALDKLTPNTEDYIKQLTEIQKAHDVLLMRYEQFGKILRPDIIHARNLEKLPPIPSAGKLADNPNYKTIKEAIAKAESQFGDMTDDQIKRLREVIEKERGTPEERTWEIKPEDRPTKGGGVATATETKVNKGKTETKPLTEEEFNRLTKEEKAAYKAERELEKAKKEYSKAPRIEEDIAKRKPRKFDISSREIREIAASGAVEAITRVIGRPLHEITTEGQIKTAIQINLEYQTRLQGALQNATDAFTDTYTHTGSKTASYTAAKNAIKAKAQTGSQTKVNTVIDTAVKTAVETIIRTIITPKKDISPLQGGDLQIERVEGIPKDPGTVSWNRGINQVEITPPYREGSDDIHFTRLKKPQTGKDSQERTLKVREGDAPSLIVLGRQGGIVQTHIIKGTRMKHIRQPIRSRRGPGILTAGGRIVRQRRGTVLR